MFGGDAQDAYAHSPPPDVPTFVEINDAYADWYKHRFGVDLDHSMVLPVRHALQGHPESGKLWEKHINGLLLGSEFNLHTTTHDRTIYHGSFEGSHILLLRQVDDFALACANEDIAKRFYSKLGSALQLPSESSPPFSYLGLLSDFNGVDVTQTSTTIKISCSKYIHHVLQTHGWSEPSRSSTKRIMSPLPNDSLGQMYSASGPGEGTSEHQALVNKH